MKTDLEIALEVSRGLIPWFRRHRRDLPWRKNRTPYRVWVSELMLQQTRVDTVVGYYRAWMRRFPSLRSLAAAEPDDVLRAWEGLGYYSRARNAHRTARLLVREKGGRFPRTLEGLRALPGVGAYTAAAVGSLALGLDVAVVDGNVIRVLARLYGVAEDVGRPVVRARIAALAEAHLVPGRAGEINEATMELGAMVCTPRNPRCGVCPLRDVCRAVQTDDPERFPVRTPRKPVPHIEVGAGVVVNRAGWFLLGRRPEQAMLGGLWEFPGGRREAGESVMECIVRELHEELRIRVRVGPLLAVVPHAFSHFTMDLHAYWARIDRGRPFAVGCSAYRWVQGRDLTRYPMPKADGVLRRRLQHLEPPRF